jgi:hypothetical protein
MLLEFGEHGVVDSDRRAHLILQPASIGTMLIYQCERLQGYLLTFLIHSGLGKLLGAVSQIPSRAHLGLARVTRP